MSLLQEKIEQAIAVLQEQEIDCWLTFVRETSGVRDPMLDFLIGSHDLTWPSAIILTRTGEKIAIVGNLEREVITRLGVFDTIVGYDTGVSAPLCETITRLAPAQIAVNTSRNNVHADGLTHAMYEMLREYLKDTPYAESLVSAEPIVNALRGRKTPNELARIRKAVEITDEIFRKTFDFIRVGMTEIMIGEYMQRLAEEHGVGLAWAAESCPAVNSGPDSPVGHSGPTDIQVQRGHIIHFDFGVRYEEYCSDIQRIAYVLDTDETQAPPAVQRGFMTIRTAIEKAREAMKPGVTGNSIDAIAREVLITEGYPEFPHALGHQLGRVAHDGGALLGPLWEKYGEDPLQPLEVGQIFTIEPGLAVPGFGHVALEEDVVIATQGAQYIGEPQREIVLLRG